jgi:hypothetical protein
MHVFIPNKVFQTHQTGNLSKHNWKSHQCILHVTATCYLCTESTFLWMRQDTEAGTIVGDLFVCVACIFGFLFNLPSALVNLSFDTWHASPSYNLGPVFRSFSPSLLVYLIFMAAVWGERSGQSRLAACRSILPYGKMRIIAV